MPRYIYPPRAVAKIRPTQLLDYERSGEWLCQRKFNGDRCPIQFLDGNVQMWNRYGRHQSYRITPELRNQLSGLNLPSGECWLDAELMHPRLSNTVILFDILHHDGHYLIGKSQTERLELLSRVCETPVDVDFSFGYRVRPLIFLAQSWDSDFSVHYQECLDSDLIEGLVLRRKGSVLSNFGSSEYEADWQVRCRKPSKNYRH